jgi:hypothetical protein
MSNLSLADFEASARADGYDEFLERQWQPGMVLDTHSHPFDARAVVTQGEMWLTQQGTTRHLTPGDTFTLARDEAHAERYGPHGAIYWVARRHHRR